MLWKEGIFITAVAHAPEFASSAAPVFENGPEFLGWVDADSIRGLREEREAARVRARAILDGRRRLLNEGDSEQQVPYAVDPLTTAARANQARRTHGKESSQAAEARQSLTTDTKRLLAEAMRKRTWEFFPETRQTFDSAANAYHFLGRCLIDMVSDGITPIAEDEELGYRLGEYVEEATYIAVRKLGHLAVGNLTVLRPGQPEANSTLPDTRVTTISECADWAKAAHARGSELGLGGYVPENDKFMIRGVRYGKDARYQEQLGLSGENITHDDIVEFLREVGVAQQGEMLSKAEVREKQVINVTGEGVVAVGKRLDAIASKRTGKRIFMGEIVADDHPMDYAAIEAEAVARQEKLDASSEDLADFLMTLEQSGIDHWSAMGLVERQVKKIVFGLVKHNPDQAEVAFNVQTAKRLRELAETRGQHTEDAIRAIERDIEADAPPVVFCGAGSCGLVEAVGPEADAMKVLLGFEEGDDMVHDVERSCTSCGKTGNIYYVYNSKKLNKGCTCGATEFTTKGK